MESYKWRDHSDLFYTDTSLDTWLCPFGVRIREVQLYVPVQARKGEGSRFKRVEEEIPGLVTTNCKSFPSTMLFKASQEGPVWVKFQQVTWPCWRDNDEMATDNMRCRQIQTRVSSSFLLSTEVAKTKCRIMKRYMYSILRFYSLSSNFFPDQSLVFFSFRWALTRLQSMWKQYWRCCMVIVGLGWLCSTPCTCLQNKV